MSSGVSRGFPNRCSMAPVLTPSRLAIGDIDLALHHVHEEVVDGEAVETWLALLTPEERARAERFRHAGDRRRCIVGRGVLRTLLGRRLGRSPAALAFGVNAHGKPTLADAGEIAFNVSHSGAYVLVAVGRAEAIGVDVEQVRPGLDVLGVGRKVFTPAELALIVAAPDGLRTQRFTRQWTFKEAVSKAVGLGLSLDLKRFEVAFLDERPRLICHGASQLGAASDWRLETVQVARGYCAALAVRPWDKGE